MPLQGGILLCSCAFSVNMFPADWSSADIAAIQSLDSKPGEFFVLLSSEGNSTLACGWYHVFDISPRRLGCIQSGTVQSLCGIVSVTKTAYLTLGKAVDCNNLDARCSEFDSNHIGSCDPVVTTLMGNECFGNPC